MNRIRSGHAYDCVLDSPLGRLGVRLHDNSITRLDYLGNKAALKPAATPPGKRLAVQLTHYFTDPQSRFTLPVELHGTDFQQRVWRALTRIPPGRTLTYGELAAKLGSGARAVGNACRNNPVSIIIPCHRVVSRSGIGGYSGKTGGREIDRKQWLLVHEGVTGQALKTSRRAPTSGLVQRKQRNIPA